MTTATINKLAAAILLSTATVATAMADSHGDIHSITGSGLWVFPPDYWFPGSEGSVVTTSISAHQKADGSVEGTATTHGWSDSQSAPNVFVEDITCLTVDGNTAYFEGVVRYSNNLTFIKPGDEEIGFVIDNNGTGPDIFWIGPIIYFLKPGEDCTAKPTLIPYPLTSGNFIVR
jgi:hypothetical protein